MKKIFFVISLWAFVACNNNPGSTEVPVDDTLKTVKTEVKGPSTPPVKVIGAFAGELPCSDCDKLGLLLTLNETSYERAQHKVAPKIKSDLLASSKGTCRQDSGFISLLNADGKAMEWYKIISIDSIEFVNKMAKPVDKSKHYYLVRKDGQKLVK